MAKNIQPNFRAYVMAVNRVERLLRKVTRALDEAGLAYAVIGGNAVAAWVATVDPDATRTTKDVDLLVRRDDLPQIDAALEVHGLKRIEVSGVSMYVSRRRPSPKAAAHLLFANERVGEHDAHPAPDVTDAVTDIAQFRVIDLLSLVRMKLMAYRRLDQVHLEDLLRIGLIDAALVRELPDDLLDRLRYVRDTMEWFTEPPEF